MCKSYHVLVVISDLLCYFHPKIASVKLVRTPPKAMKWGWAPAPPVRKVSIETWLFFINGLPEVPESCTTIRPRRTLLIVHPQNALSSNSITTVWPESLGSKSPASHILLILVKSRYPSNVRSTWTLHFQQSMDLNGDEGAWICKIQDHLNKYSKVIWVDFYFTY